jgi:hypothetical protein
VNLFPHNEFDLVEGFAKQYGNDLAYVASRGQWFYRSVDNDGQPCWEPDERSQVFYWIRLVLRELAGSLKPNPAICTAAAVRAVEELARYDPNFAITEADLAPGELAKADAFMECFRQAPPPSNPTQSTAPPQATPKPKARPPKPRQPKPKPANPAPKVDDPGITTTPRSLMDDMARWAAIGSASNG